MNRILLIEDDPGLSRSIPDYLATEGFVVERLGTIAQATARLASGELPRLVILDWMLPDGQGIDLLRSLRARYTGMELPILLLTARGDLIDKIVGLETGANDYLTKPFEPRELVARIRAQLRLAAQASPSASSASTSRTSSAAAQACPPPASVLSAGAIEIDPLSRTARFRGVLVELTKMEFELLKLFVENPNRVFTRDELLNQVWGYESYPTTRTVDTHVLQLRQKFEASLFETVRGVGYRLKT